MIVDDKFRISVCVFLCVFCALCSNLFLKPKTVEFVLCDIGVRPLELIPSVTNIRNGRRSRNEKSSTENRNEM